MVKIKLAGEAYIDTFSIYWGLFDCFHILNFLLLYLTLSVTVLLHFYIILPVFTTTAFYLPYNSRNYNLIIFYFGLVYRMVFFSSFVHIYVVYKVSVEEPGLVIHSIY